MYHNGSWQAPWTTVVLIKEARVSPPFGGNIACTYAIFLSPGRGASIARSGTVAPLSGTCLNETTYLQVDSGGHVQLNERLRVSATEITHDRSSRFPVLGTRKRSGRRRPPVAFRIHQGLLHFHSLFLFLLLLFFLAALGD